MENMHFLELLKEYGVPETVLNSGERSMLCLEDDYVFAQERIKLVIIAKRGLDEKIPELLPATEKEELDQVYKELAQALNRVILCEMALL